MARNPFKRSIDVPAEVVAGTPLRNGENVLAGAIALDGTWLLGTRDALLITGDASVTADAPARISWEHVERADWDHEQSRLRVIEVGEFGKVRPEYTFEIADPGLLLEFIRERVTASVVLQRHVAVSGKKGLFVIARRAPRGDSDITWSYEFDRGIDPDDPLVMETAKRGLKSAAEELGL